MTPKQLEELIFANHRSLELLAGQWTSTPEDCVQEAFLKLFSTRQTIDNPKAWLFRVVRNMAIDSGRSESSRKNREQIVGKTKPQFVENNDTPYSINEVQLALQKLPGQQREIIVARIWGKLTLDEIAEAFDIATSTAHRRYELGILSLRKKLDIQTDQPKTDFSKALRNK